MESAIKNEGTEEEESTDSKEDPNGMMAMFKKWNIHTLSHWFDDLRHDIRTIEAWCQSSIKDLEERTTSAFATSVDMIDKAEERIEEIEQQQVDQK